MRTYQERNNNYGHVSHGEAPYSQAIRARKTPTLLEARFRQEARQRWPSLSWRRYAPVTIQAHPDHKSTWFAPFLNIPNKLIVILDDRPDFPYRIYGQDWALYLRHGYTIIDFSEDFWCSMDDSVWQDAMEIVDQVVHVRQVA